MLRKPAGRDVPHRLRSAYRAAPGRSQGPGRSADPPRDRGGPRDHGAARSRGGRAAARLSGAKSLTPGIPSHNIAFETFFMRSHGMFMRKTLAVVAFTAPLAFLPCGGGGKQEDPPAAAAT